jgi:ribulose-phosphate 3-epimerase
MSVSCIVPTVVPAGPEDIVAARQRYRFTQTLHIDVADGIFAKNRTWTPPPGYKLPEHLAVLYEVHLMAEQPLALGLAYAHAGARRMIAHIESFRHADAAQDAFTMWRGAGVKEIGAAILLDTPPKELAPYAELVDFIHVMSIAEVGTQGKPFESTVLERISRLHGQYPRLAISVDGGVVKGVMSRLREAGVSRYCVGAALAEAADPEAAFGALGELCTAGR